jgi:hypothetical protein
MSASIVETLPWIDYREVFQKLEERGKSVGKAEGRAEGKAEGRAEGKAEGKVEGKAERDMEIALTMFARVGDGTSQDAAANTLKDLGIADDVIIAAREQAEGEGLFRGKKGSEGWQGC